MEGEFRNLFIRDLKDILSAEKQLVKALPALVLAANHKDLKQALRDHLKETKGHVGRLKEIFKELSIPFKEDRSCYTMQGLIKECKEAVSLHAKSPVRDAAIIAHGQRVEHYEIAVYGTLCAFARHLGLSSVNKLLKETLNEEGHADKKLTKIAEGSVFVKGVNKKAVNK